MRCNMKAPARVVGPRNFCQSLTSQISTRRAEGTYDPTHQWPDRAACLALRATGAGTRDVPSVERHVECRSAELPKAARLGAQGAGARALLRCRNSY